MVVAGLDRGGEPPERARGQRDSQHGVGQQVQLPRPGVERERALTAATVGQPCDHQRGALLGEERGEAGERQRPRPSGVSRREAQRRPVRDAGAPPKGRQHRRGGKPDHAERRPYGEDQLGPGAELAERRPPVRDGREQEVGRDHHEAADDGCSGAGQVGPAGLKRPTEHDGHSVQRDLRGEYADHPRTQLDRFAPARVVPAEEDRNGRLRDDREQHGHRDQHQECPGQQGRHRLAGRRSLPPLEPPDEERHDDARQGATRDDLEGDVGQQVGGVVDIPETRVADSLGEDQDAAEPDYA